MNLTKSRKLATSLTFDTLPPYFIKIAYGVSEMVNITQTLSVLIANHLADAELRQATATHRCLGDCRRARFFFLSMIVREAVSPNLSHTLNRRGLMNPPRP